MIDLHMHTLLSDGVLIPSELVRRARVKGYRALAITDHVDAGNVETLVPQLVELCERLNLHAGVVVVPGVEVTHVPLPDLEAVVASARAAGAHLIVVHGETLVEPVAPGTNRRALELDIDVLAHPGLITREEAALAARRGIALEISSRRGHSLSNGHVAQMAALTGAKLILNTDAHAPEDLLTLPEAKRVAQGAGLKGGQIDRLYAESARLVERVSGRRVSGKNRRVSGKKA
ncbi:MAG: histidinol phosphate phosphatase domain-containing protein [Candidatus Omnitrophica bacterium]|nr:histidinol phosphate phosphatase domain-containing protein [Candidatus Omnitrophota bacterium]